MGVRDWSECTVEPGTTGDRVTDPWVAKKSMYNYSQVSTSVDWKCHYVI